MQNQLYLEGYVCQKRCQCGMKMKRNVCNVIIRTNTSLTYQSEVDKKAGVLASLRQIG